MQSPWPRIVVRTLGLLASSALLGWLFGQTSAFLLVSALGSLAWQLFHLYRLERWLREGPSSQPPGCQPFRTGLMWREVYHRVFLLRERSRKRKRKLSRIIKQFRAMAAALPDAIVILGETDEILWCNRASQTLLGLRPSQDIDLPITLLLRHPDFVAFLDRQLYDGSLEFPSPVNADFTLSARIIPFRKKQHLLLVADISRVQRLEQMRRDFVANVSHELRTPLTVIAGYLETLRDTEALAAGQWRQPLLRMQQQSTRMLHLIEDLLLLSKLETQLEPPVQRPVNIAVILGSIVEDAVALSGDRKHIITVDADRGLWVKGCEQQLRSAFSNLVFNAIRYTPEGSHIAIRWYADAEGAHFQVEDDGEGIPPQHIPRITERFYRVDRSRDREHGGTGLGLAIVKHVMNNHNGQLHISSQVGLGSVFTCDFPPQRQIVMQKKLPALAKG